MSVNRDARNRSVSFTDQDWEKIGQLAEDAGLSRGKWIEQACKEKAARAGVRLIGTRQHGGHRQRLDQQAIADTLMALVNRSPGERREAAQIVVNFENSAWRPLAMRGCIEAHPDFMLDWPTLRYTGAQGATIDAIRSLLVEYANTAKKRAPRE